MGALNGKPVGRPPHKNSKEAPPVARDELSTWPYAELLRMNADFCRAMERAIKKRGLRQQHNHDSARP